MAERVREDRQPAADDNPFLALQEILSEQIVAGLDAWRDDDETLAERMFLYRLRLTRAAGGGRHRSGGYAAAAQGGKERRCIANCCNPGSPS